MVDLNGDLDSDDNAALLTSRRATDGVPARDDAADRYEKTRRSTQSDKSRVIANRPTIT